MKNINVLDCTLRDGAYIVEGEFGSSVINGLINKLQGAGIDIIECGWLKNQEYAEGSSYYHEPADIEKFLLNKNENITYVAMIDWDRYDLSYLSDYNGRSIDAIRVVFPKQRYEEAVSVGKRIRKKGYKVFFQAANTLGYSDAELLKLIKEINNFKPEALSIVDTFGAMYEEDLLRIVSIMEHNLDSDIALGLHMHNNLQQAFALSMSFVNRLGYSCRRLIIDASLAGMGRGAGNTPTELITDFLNKKFRSIYDLDIIMDAIDTYMTKFIKNYHWGYSIPLFLSGTYCSHVNNIAYLTKSHRTKNKEIKGILESLPQEKRLVYDYDLLEKKYLAYQSHEIDDSKDIEQLKAELFEKHVLLIAPGKSVEKNQEKINRLIKKKQLIVIGTNAIIPGFQYDYVFFSNSVRFQYALDTYRILMGKVNIIITSNLNVEKSKCKDLNMKLINYNNLIKQGWVHFDNSLIMCMRLLDQLHVSEIQIAGLDGYNESKNYADEVLQSDIENKEIVQLNQEIKEMLMDFLRQKKNVDDVIFATDSLYKE